MPGKGGLPCINLYIFHNSYFGLLSIKYICVYIKVGLYLLKKNQKSEQVQAFCEEKGLSP